MCEVLYIIRFVLDSKPYLQALMRGSFLLLASACILVHGASALSSGHQTASVMSSLTPARNNSRVIIVIIRQAKLAIFECTCELTRATSPLLASIARSAPLLRVI